MIKYILVILFVTLTVARSPHHRGKRGCGCGNVKSHSDSSSWSSEGSSSGSSEEDVFPCQKHKSSSSSSSEDTSFNVKLSKERDDLEVSGYKDIVVRKRVKQHHQRAIGCSYNNLRISCQPDYIIKIISANYGRTCNKYCLESEGMTNVTDCYCPSATDIVRWYCQDAGFCRIYVSDYVFYDMCPGVSKYLEVIYDCVKVDECKDKVNMRFTTCAPCEQATCLVPCDYTVTQNCAPGCVCTGNTVLDTESGYCVTSDMCPYYDPGHPQCSGNEVFSHNATTSKCQPSCDNGGDETDPCPSGTGNGYVCEPGKVRNRAGRCVSPCACPCDSAIRESGQITAQTTEATTTTV